ncbi:GGDEF domain-containing protein [Rhizobium sp. CNPSo 4039]|uniref:GGDEF domain-containing protein n=1 Tax=Rhizobium sp. CNPSo 4039 TaxID=3021409 RepID=UPI0025504D2A|nr:GGDEF domain-containing protein [Rhizobium sp. CNPSo 4039]MDK4717379.1 GGDEF domain-containing protein [Rhizobium sp. CNPSo 4039]
MINELDMPTVLFLQKTSYIAGAVTLGYLKYSSNESRGVGLLASSFVILAAASTLAGYAETYPAFYAPLSLINLVCAVLGYSLLGSSFVVISDPDRKVIPALALLPALLTLLVGAFTAFHLNNTYRAVTFNFLGCVMLAGAAIVIFRDSFREPLPIRKFVAAILVACSLLSLIMAFEFSFHSFVLLDVASGFLLMILSKFVLALSIVIFISERQQIKLRQTAERDGLTGLYNRRFFNENASGRLRDGDAILYLDIDHFKHFNDRWGHAAGDEVLVAVSRTIEAILPASAIFARQGGEEFIVFLPLKAGEPLIHAERIREAVQQTRFPDLGADVVVTTSIGISKVRRECRSLTELCREADRALYLAKAGGRNRVCDASSDFIAEVYVRSA